MKRGLRLTIASAAVAALALPTLALGQGAAPAPKLTESTTSGFPDKAYLVALDKTRPLNTSQVQRDRERPAGRRPRGGSAGRLEERRAPARRRVEQHEGRSNPGCNGRRSCVPHRAEERPARSRSSPSTRTSRPSRTSPRTRRISRRRSRRRPPRPRAPTSTTLSSKPRTRRRIRDSSERQSSFCRTARTTTRARPAFLRPLPR